MGHAQLPGDDTGPDAVVRHLHDLVADMVGQRPSVDEHSSELIDSALAERCRDWTRGGETALTSPSDPAACRHLLRPTGECCRAGTRGRSSRGPFRPPHALRPPTFPRFLTTAPPPALTFQREAAARVALPGSGTHHPGHGPGQRGHRGGVARSCPGAAAGESAVRAATRGGDAAGGGEGPLPAAPSSVTRAAPRREGRTGPRGSRSGAGGAGRAAAALSRE